MRLIFIVLLAANLFFLGFNLLSGKTVTEDVVPDFSVGHQGSKLQTLQERDKKSDLALNTQKKNEIEEVAASSVPNDAERCQLVGPFVELLHAEYLIERLAGLGVAASIKNIEVADGKGYWVYLKPEMSEKEALRRLYEIQAKAIDSYIIPTGELANGISFGQFSDETEAKNKAEQIRGQGYAVDIKEIIKNHSEVWVELKSELGQKLSEEQWLALLKEEKSIERRKNYCLGVAN